MDKIDEWMNRMMGNKVTKLPEIDSNKSTAKKAFVKKPQHFHFQRQNTPRHGSQNQSRTGQPRPQHQKPNQPRPNRPQVQKSKFQSRNAGPKPPYPKQNYQRINQKQNLKKKQKFTPIIKGKLKIIPLGGLNEVGKNMMVFEYENDIIIVDMGLEFPSEDLLGIDYVIPDVSYLEENRKRIKGVVITHGHLDHIGGIPYILPKLDFPAMYGTKLTMGLVRKRIEEFNQEKQADLRVVDSNDVIKLGAFTIRFFRVVHSVPDSVGIIIETPVGKVVHTGDFKFDDDPSGDQKPAELQKLKALGYQNVLALFADSTNALKPGHTMSEKQVGRTLEEIVKKTKGRLIIASFSSLIGRIQQIIEYAKKYNRKIFVSGKSMMDNMGIARNLGFLKFSNEEVKDIKKCKNIKDHEMLILTTGSQGESMSALTRIANGEHAHIKVKKGDTIVLSASPIIGNERAIFNVINKLCMLGARVVNNQMMDVHTSGHAYQEELKQMIDYVRPKFFIPIHGEYFMRQAHALLAQEKCKIPGSNVILIQNGDVLLAERGKVSKSAETVDTKYILIDGLGEGQMGSQVQVDRAIMSENGALIVLIHVSKKGKKLIKTPDVVSRGFTYMKESDEVTQEIAKIAGDAFRRIREKNPGADRKDVKRYIQQTIDKYTHNKLERRPLIIPLIIES